MGPPRWSVVRVPFPYVERPIVQFRPALVVACPPTPIALLWVLMITSAANRGWTGDVEITDLASAGLRVASVIRTSKIATITEADVTVLGLLSRSDQTTVAGQLRLLLP